MWHCSRCGETIPDNFDVCWHCGASREGAAAKEFHAEPDDPSVPDPKPDATESEQTPGDKMPPSGLPERALTRENLATLLLRFLGVYLASLGIVGFVTEVFNILLLSRRLGLDDAFAHYHLEYLAHPGAELLIGIYFMVGGQWVYDKILTPMFRSSKDDASPESEDVCLADSQMKNNSQIANDDQPQVHH